MKRSGWDAILNRGQGSPSAICRDWLSRSPDLSCIGFGGWGVWGLGFRVAAFGFGISVFFSRSSGFGLWVSGSGFRISVFDFQVLTRSTGPALYRVCAFGFRVSGPDRVSGFGFRVQGSGFRVSGSGFGFRI